MGRDSGLKTLIRPLLTHKPFKTATANIIPTNHVTPVELLPQCNVEH